MPDMYRNQPLIEFSEHTFEPAPAIFAHWHTTNGDVPVTIIAYSLGATIAFCVIGLGRSKMLEPGNYGTAWVPCNKLTLE